VRTQTTAVNTNNDGQQKSIGKMKEKKKPEKELVKVHPDLKGFDVSINPLGEIVSTIDIDQINDFLNKNLYDKKLKNKAAPESETKNEDENADED
jgi:hypothetical protein